MLGTLVNDNVQLVFDGSWSFMTVNSYVHPLDTWFFVNFGPNLACFISNRTEKGLVSYLGLLGPTHVRTFGK